MECPACKTKTGDDAKYCHQCGRRLALEPGGQWSASDPESGENARLRERKDVTVLFADIANSTEIISELDPEEVLDFLDGVTSSLVDAVHRYGGTVKQVMGDGIMAFFGAPIAVEDHATHACLAALEMQDMLASARQEGVASEIGDVKLRTGISTGEVVIRTLQSRTLIDFSAMGATTHLSARLEQLAEPDTIVCSRQTCRLAGPRFQWRPLGWTRVRGFLKPMEIFQLLSVDPSKGRFEALIESRLSTFVDREDDLEKILKCFDPANQEAAKVAIILGEAGVGKSRLCWEVIDNGLNDTWQHLKVEANSYDQDIPYLPFVTMLRNYFGIGTSDSEKVVISKIRKQLKILEPGLQNRTAAILSIFGAKIEDPEWFRIDASRRQQVAHETVCRVLVAESRRSPLVVLVEDVQWIDSDSQILLRYIISNTPDSDLIFLLTSRSPLQGLPKDPPEIVEIMLTPLPEPSAEKLIDALSGGDATLAVLKRELIERTAGNPFFIEESIKSLADTGILSGDPGHYRLSKSLGKIEMPPSVKSVITSRVDRLSLSDKKALQAAAVIGREFSFRMLQRIVPEQPESGLSDQLARLTEAGLIRIEEAQPQRRYRFTHALIHEVVCRAFLRHQKTALHVKALAAVEELFADRLEELTETLAHHAKAGEVLDKALHYSWAAGRRAAQRSSYKRAVDYFEEALQYCELLSQDSESLKQSIDISFDLRNALYPLGKIQRDLDNLQRIDRQNRGLIEASRHAWLSAYMARDLALLGRPDDCIAAGHHALALAHRAQNKELEILTNAYIASAHYALGAYRQSVTLLETAITELAQGYQDHDFGLPGSGYLFFGAWRLWALARLGEFEDGSRFAEELVRYSRSLDHPLTSAVAIYSAGFLHLHRDALDVAIPLLSEGLQICEDWDLVAWFTNLSSALGYAHVLGGNAKRGRQHLEAAVERSRDLGIMVSHSLEMAWLAEARLACGEQDLARDTLQRALELSEDYKEWGNKAEVLRIFGEISALGGNEEQATAKNYYEDAMSLAKACQMEPLIARCHSRLARY